MVWRPGPQVFPFLKGRVALYAILRAAGIGKGDEVIVPGFTCVVVAAAVQYTGARPVFYDIDRRTLNGDPALAAQLITNRTKAVLVQHSFGMPADLGDLPRLCRERGILLVEDCAHAIGATLDGQPVGTLGDAAFASFQWSKPVTTGLGGLALVNTDTLRERMVRLYDTEFQEPSLVKSLYLSLLSGAYNRFYRPSLYWRARETYHRLTALGLVQGSSSDSELTDPAMPPRYRERFGRLRRRQIDVALVRLPSVIAHRRHIAALYADWCRGQGIPVQEGPPGAESVWLRFPLLVEDRPALLHEARRRRIELGDWFNAPLHPSVADPGVFGYREGMCPVADEVCRRIVNLPTHPGVSEREAERVMRFLEGSPVAGTSGGKTGQES